MSAKVTGHTIWDINAVESYAYEYDGFEGLYAPYSRTRCSRPQPDPGRRGHQDRHPREGQGLPLIRVRHRAAASSLLGGGAAAVPWSMTTSEQPTVSKTDEEWRAQLSPEEYAVLRQAGTERPWTGEYVDTKTVGVYECRACGAELFRSDTKFDSHCGWPSFYEASAERQRRPPRGPQPRAWSAPRCCAVRCHSHLGHLFDDAPQTPTGDRYCINSVSIRLAPAEG